MVINQDRVNQLKASQSLHFEEALYLLRAGEKVMRTGWKNIRYIELQKPDENSKMKRAYIFCVPIDNQLVPWTISNSDLFAQDWQVFKA